MLHLAAAKGSTSVVEALLNIDGYDNIRSVSLCGVRILYPHSIDKDPRDVLDRTPLHYASMEGHSDVVYLLTEHRALDSCIDKHG